MTAFDSHQPVSDFRRRAATQTEVVVLIGAILLGVILFTFIFPRSYTRSDRHRYAAVCAANLKGMGAGFYTFEKENDGMWPGVPLTPPDEDMVGVGNVDYVGATAPTSTTSVTSSWYTLVREGFSTPKSFRCPSSDDTPLEIDDPLWLDPAAANPVPRTDFDNIRNCSYGYQVPFGNKGIPSSARDARMPLAADKGPFGMALEAGAKHPGTPSSEADAKEEAWSTWNSPNHRGEGQNILFADSHVEFMTKPIAGVHQDNIYTRWSDGSGSLISRIHGTPPTRNETPWSDTDSLIYP